MSTNEQKKRCFPEEIAPCESRATELRKRTLADRGGKLFPPERATAHLDTFLALRVYCQNPPGLHRRALALADAFGLPAAYDAHYLALAEYLGCAFWTDDQRLIRDVGASLPSVRPLHDYIPVEPHG